jgi:hypothetical protein
MQHLRFQYVLASLLVLSILVSYRTAALADSTELFLNIDDGTGPPPPPPVDPGYSTGSDNGTIYLPPGQGSPGTPTTPKPQESESLKLSEFQPKFAYDRMPFLMTVYGSGFDQNSKIIIGHREFKANLGLDGDRQILQAKVAEKVFAPGIYDVGVKRTNGDTEFLGGFEIKHGVYSAKVVSQSVNPTVELYQDTSLTVTVKNTGNLPWYRTGSQPVRLGTTNPRDRVSKFYTTSWILKNRPANLGTDVVYPGEQATFSFTVEAKDFGGKTVTENFGLVAEHEEWFMEGISWNITVKAQPTIFQKIKTVYSNRNQIAQGLKPQPTATAPAVTPTKTQTVYSSDPTTTWLEKIFRFLLRLVTR